MIRRGTEAYLALRLSCSSHCQPIYAKGWLTYAHRHALAFLSTCTHTWIKRQIVTDHRNASEYIGAVADEGGAFHRIRNFSVFDHVGFRSRKYEFPAGDIHLSAAEIDRV